jgi:hypothetical protein
MVGPDAIRVERVVLVGPEGDAWGTWSIEQEAIAREIDETLLCQGEDRATGVYQCKLIGLDNTNNQIALLPVRVNGRQALAQGAGAEATALQRATGLMVNTFEQVVLAQSNQIQKLTDAVESLMEDRTILVEEFNKQQSQNLDVELRRLEWERKVQREEQIVGFLKDAAGPTLLAALNAWTENQEEERNKRKEQKRLQARKYPPGWPDPDENTNGGAAPPTEPSGKTPPAAADQADQVEPDQAPGGAVSPVEEPVVQAQGFPAPPQKQAGTPGSPREAPPPATAPATPASPSATMPPEADATDAKPADGSRGDRADDARGAKADGRGGRTRSGRRSSARSRRKTPKG